MTSFEDIDVDGANTYGRWGSTHANFIVDPAWGRNGAGVRVYPNNWDGWSTPVWTGVSTIVLGCYYRVEGTGGNSQADFSFREGTATTNSHIAVRHIASNRSFDVWRGPSLGTLLGQTADNVYNVGAWHHLEIKVVIHDTTGSVEIRLDGATILNLTNQDTRNGGTGVVDRVYGGTNSGAPYNMDSLYINDTDFLGPCVVEAIKPNAAGNYTQLTPSAGANYLTVDDAPNPDDDSTYVSSGTATNKDTYAHGDLTADTSAAVYAVQIGTIARHEGAGGTYRQMHRRSTTDSFGPAHTPPASYGWDGHIWDQDPAAGPGAWTVANVNASEFGVEIVS